MEAIKGVRSDVEQNRWWYFDVNGYRSNVAAERYLVKNGDRIRWLYLATPKRSSMTPSQAAEVADGAFSRSGRPADIYPLAERGRV